jgi:hypothetical protein
MVIMQNTFFSFSGKTRFIIKLINNAESMFVEKPTKIVYAYGVFQEVFKELEANVPNLVLHEGLPSEKFVDEELDTSKYNFLVLDDLLEEIGKSKEICNLFTRGMHHKKVSIAILFQNLFHQSPYMRTISLNLSYFVLHKTFRDRQQIAYLAKQMFGANSARMIEAYEDCIKKEWGSNYLVVCNYPTMNEEDRLVTSIFPGDILTIYMPK